MGAFYRVLAPLLTETVGTGDEQAVQNGHEDSPLHIKLKLPLAWQ